MVVEGDKAIIITFLVITIFSIVVGGTAIYLANRQLREMKK